MSNSPDVSPYVDLTLFDSSSQAIFEKALDYALVALPELQPREGSIETILLQAVSLEVQYAIYAINRLPGAVVEVLLRLLDIERNTGARATAVAKFEGDSTTSFLVAVSYSVSAKLLDSIWLIIFVPLISSLIIPISQI